MHIKYYDGISEYKKKSARLFAKRKIPKLIFCVPGKKELFYFLLLFFFIFVLGQKELCREAHTSRHS